MGEDRKRLQLIYGERYSRIYAIDRESWNCCFYCGDIATEHDHVPPLSTVEFFDITGEIADYFLVPSCRECNLLGGSEPQGILDSRAEFIRIRLRSRYAKQWRQSQLWTKEEVEDLIEEVGVTNLTKSIKAIVDSEKDLTSRLKFTGYIFEVRGVRYRGGSARANKYSVFGSHFETFKDALQYAIDNYKVKAAVLFKYSVEEKGNVELALRRIFREQAQLIADRELGQIASRIAKAYTAPVKWVLRTLKGMKEANPDVCNEDLEAMFIERHLKKEE